MSIYPSTKVTPYVYCLTHKETGQFYIGYREINKVPSNQDLGLKYFTSSRKIRELGFDNFEFKILAEFFDGNSAYEHENRLIEQNIKNPLCLNRSFTKEGSRKFSSAGKPLSPEIKAKISAGNKGKHVSDETRAKLAARIVSEETKAKISLAKQNMSDETKSKMSASAKVKIFTEEHRRNISLGGLGRKNSPEHIEKSRQGHLGAKRSEETKAKIKEKRALQDCSTTWTIQDPTGKIIVTKMKLKEFCKENKLGLSKLRDTQQTKKPVESGLSTGWMIVKRD